MKRLRLTCKNQSGIHLCAALKTPTPAPKIVQLKGLGHEPLRQLRGSGIVLP